MDAWMKKKQEREQERKESVAKLEEKLEAIRKERVQKKEEVKDRKEVVTVEADRGLEERRLESEKLKKQLAEARAKEDVDRY